jgi:EAL domain-containing protein (putative c-di-GMP-specific phosphodiesterase class I)/ActR/RegA family two-component response regulator
MQTVDSGVPVLIIDDDRKYVEALHRNAQRFGIVLRHAGNLEDAREIILGEEGAQLCGVILDVICLRERGQRVPDNSFIIAASRFLADKAPHLPAVVLTGEPAQYKNLSELFRGTMAVFSKGTGEDDLLGFLAREAAKLDGLKYRSRHPEVFSVVSRYLTAETEQELIGIFKQLESTPLRISSGWACRQQRDLSEWLAAADFLLSQARQHSDEVCAVERASLQAPDISARRVVDWTNRISQSLAMKRVRLYSQATLSIDAAGNRQEMHSELLAVLLDENTTEQAASQWLEIAAKQGLLAELDGIVLEIMASYSGDRRGAMVVNLSCQSWQDQAFVDALPRLRKCLGQFDRVLFELREEDVVPLLKTAVKFVQTAKQAGFGVAIDRFGVAAGGIACLRELLPEYVKLDVSLVKNIDTDAGRFHLESLVTIARTLDIQVLALSFDQDDILEELQRLGISGVQGYAFASKKLFADCL